MASDAGDQEHTNPHRVTTNRLTNLIHASSAQPALHIHPHIKKTLSRLYMSINRDAIITQCNATYVKKLGYDSADDVVGTHIDTHVPHNARTEMHRMFEEWWILVDQVSEEGAVDDQKFTGWWESPTLMTHTVMIMDKHGTPIEFMARISGRADDSGRITEMSMIMTNMNELKSLQTLVRIKKYESLYENSPDLYRTVNYNGTILDCNITYIKKLGFSDKSEVLGKNLVEHTAARSVEALRNNMASWRRTATGTTSEIWMKKKDGTIFPSILTPTNIYDDDGNLIGRNVVIKDATELYDTKSMLSEQEKTERMKEEFLSAVTHELKSPLTPIIGFAQALKRPKLLGELNQKQSDAVTTILLNAQRLRKLITDMLDAHKLDLEKMRFDIKEMSVNALMDRISKSFQIAARDKDITITSVVDGNYDSQGKPIELKMMSDTSRIEQVITNLVYNAVDFIPKGTGTVSVSAELLNNNNVKFSIRDNGCGIPEEKQKQLFHKFYQADTTHTRKHGGTGLGLSICKGIVNGLGGEIYVESTVGRGSNFYFILPINVADKNNEPGDDQDQ